MKNLYLVRQIAGGEKHVVYAEGDELEGMYQSGIINEYTYCSEEITLNEFYYDYFKHAIDTEIDEIMRDIQNAKGIKYGDCEPNHALALDQAVDNLWKVVSNIIAYEEKLKEK